MLILTGVRSPQLLPRSKEESPTVLSRRKLADLGMLTSQAGTIDPRKIKEEFKALGKIPAHPRQGSWEDRLKPIEKRQPDRGSERESAEKKKNLDELGLRRLL
jgi:hypothetical protein